MMTHRTFLRTALAAVLVAGAVAGCGSVRMSEHTTIYEAQLTGAAEVPPAFTPGTGAFEAIWNENTGVLSWTLTYSGLTGPATAAHIHGPAMAGSNAGVLIPFQGPITSPLKDRITLTPAQAAQLASGQWYVNVHTAANPGGEIRGQLKMRM